MRLKEIHNVYFIGIGGIGMSALARYFSKTGKHVAGYDKTKTEVTSNLEKNGIQIHFSDAVASIPKKFQNKKNTLVVFTPAVPSDHIELNFFINQGFQIMKRAEVLGLITKNTFCFSVAGTHGKTTTSAILGHIMQPYEATSFLGGISENYHSNLIFGAKKISVVEADEFDQSFLINTHTSKYIDLVSKSFPENGLAFLDGDTIVSPGSKEATKDAVGSIISAIDGVQQKEFKNEHRSEFF